MLYSLGEICNLGRALAKSRSVNFLHLVIAGLPILDPVPSVLLGLRNWLIEAAENRPRLAFNMTKKSTYIFPYCMLVYSFVICLRLLNGKEHFFPTNKFKVIKTTNKLIFRNRADIDAKSIYLLLQSKCTILPSYFLCVPPFCNLIFWGNKTFS